MEFQHGHGFGIIDMAPTDVGIALMRMRFVYRFFVDVGKRVDLYDKFTIVLNVKHNVRIFFILFEIEIDGHDFHEKTKEQVKHNYY